jgi:uroporphyrinogen decarboxylase
MPFNDRFLRACRREKVDRTPVWIMRQAGRYLPEYRQLRKQYSFLTLCKTPELAAQVTLQPLDVLKVDAAILFSDILVLVEAMGLKLEFLEKRGPVIAEPIRDKKAVAKLSALPDAEISLQYVMDAIKILKNDLKDRLPLIGFSGAPFTLASYMVEGGTSRDFIRLKSLMFGNTPLYKTMMEKVTVAVSNYLKAQVKAGVQAVQLFDTWAGILSPSDYKRFAWPFAKKAIKAIKGKVPVIYYANNSSALLEHIKELGADVVGIDWRIDMGNARQRLGKNIALQGNLDPCLLYSDRKIIAARVKDIIQQAGPKGHIFNLGHGILPTTPVENAVAMVEAVHRYGKR